MFIVGNFGQLNALIWELESKTQEYVRMSTLQMSYGDQRMTFESVMLSKQTKFTETALEATKRFYDQKNWVKFTVWANFLV